MRAPKSALLLLSFLTMAHADVVREPNGALLCETAKELAMALTIIQNQTQPNHNLRCWNVGPGSQLIASKLRAHICRYVSRTDQQGLPCRRG